MRLRDVQHLLTQVLPELNAEAVQIQGQNPVMSFKNMPRIRHALIRLKEVPGLTQFAEQVLANHMTTSAGDVLVSQGEGQQFLAQVEALKTITASLKTVIDR